jgi:hypothetical protein
MSARDRSPDHVELNGSCCYLCTATDPYIPCLSRTPHSAPEAVVVAVPPDVSDRLALRRNLQCANFSWYVNKFMSDIFVPGAAHNVGAGEVRSVGSGRCLDSHGALPTKVRGSDRLGMYKCHGHRGAQAFMFTEGGELRTRLGVCADAFPVPRSGSDEVDDSGEAFPQLLGIFLEPCHEMGGNQKWAVVPVPGAAQPNTVLLQHQARGLCMQAPAPRQRAVPTLEQCDEAAALQQWVWTSLKLQPEVLLRQGDEGLTT